jgi:hypothetical protein
MILLISPYQTAPDCAAQIEAATHTTVKTVDSVRVALALLRTHDYEAIVADENLLEVSPGAAEDLVQRLSAGTPVFLDMASMKPHRIAKMVAIAFRRREVEYKLARAQAIAELKSEFKSELTGLLISSKMALDSCEHSPQLSQPLTSILEIAQRMKQRLEPAK